MRTSSRWTPPLERDQHARVGDQRRALARGIAGSGTSSATATSARARQQPARRTRAGPTSAACPPDARTRSVSDRSSAAPSSAPRPPRRRRPTAGSRRSCRRRSGRTRSPAARDEHARATSRAISSVAGERLQAVQRERPRRAAPAASPRPRTRRRRACRRSRPRSTRRSAPTGSSTDHCSLSPSMYPRASVGPVVRASHGSIAALNAQATNCVPSTSRVGGRVEADLGVGGPGTTAAARRPSAAARTAARRAPIGNPPRSSSSAAGAGRRAAASAGVQRRQQYSAATRPTIAPAEVDARRRDEPAAREQHGDADDRGQRPLEDQARGDEREPLVRLEDRVPALGHHLDRHAAAPTSSIASRSSAP